jgi:amino acid transporter
MTKAKPARARLIAVDGVDPAAVLAEARAALGQPSRGGISRWDASGVFQELAVAEPAAGSFGLYAEMYLHPWAGFATRYTYWLCLVMIIGSEVVAAAIYCEFWFPHAPTWIWIGGFSIAQRRGLFCLVWT